MFENLSIKQYIEEKRKYNRRPDLVDIFPSQLPPLPIKKKKETNKVKVDINGKPIPVIGMGQLVQRDEELMKEKKRIQKQKQENERREQERLRLQRQAMQRRKRQQEEARRRLIEIENVQREQERLRLIEEQRIRAQQQRIASQRWQEEQRLRKEEERRIMEEKMRKERQQQERLQNQKKLALLKLKQEKQLKDKKRNIQLSRFKDADSEIFLDQIIEYANSIKEEAEIKCAINSVGDIKKVTKDLILWTDSFVDKININNPSEVNTFCVKVWNLITNQLIMKAKKDGIEITPPTRLDSQVYKNCINTYILMINVLRARGLERVWLYMVGKTLDLLDFIFKERQNLKDFKQLDLVQKKYIKKFGENFENIYFSRLDQLTYFLFGLLLMNPYSCFIQIADRTKYMPGDVADLVRQFDYPWDYSVFWMLIQRVRKMPFRYFKPVVYNNVLSIMTIHLVQSRKTNKNKQFISLFKTMTIQLIEFIKIQSKDPEIKQINGWLVDGYMDGSQFIDMLAPVKAAGADKKKLMDNENLEEVRNKGSVLYYFKSSQ